MVFDYLLQYVFIKEEIKLTLTQLADDQIWYLDNWIMKYVMVSTYDSWRLKTYF